MHSNFILDIENTLIKMKKKKGNANRFEEKTFQTPI